MSDPPGAAPRGLDARAIGLVLLLCLIWGMQQVAMKSVAAAVPPVLQLAIRFSLAAIFFVFLARSSGSRDLGGRGLLGSGLLLGLLFSIEFLLVGESLRHTSAAHCIVFLYTAPIFTAVGVQYLPGERLDRLQWLAIGLAFAGVVVAFWQPGGASLGATLLGDGLALAAGLSWGVSNVVLRRGRIGRAATAVTVLYQVGTAGVLLLAFAAATGQLHLAPGPGALAILAYQTLVIAMGSYLVWFWLLRHYSAARLMLATLLTPLVGVVGAAMLLGEPIEPRFALGATLVIVGILGVNRDWVLRATRSTGRAEART